MNVSLANTEVCLCTEVTMFLYYAVGGGE